MSLSLHLLLGSNSHRATLLGLSLCDILVGLSLIHLELGTDVLTYVDVGYIDGEDFECRTVVETLAEHQFGDAVGVLEYLLVALGRTDGTNDTLAYAGQHRILAGTTDQLADIGTYGHTGLSDQLDTILSHSRYRRGVDHLGVHRHLDSFKHVTSGQIDSGSHLERELHIGLGGTHQGMYHTLDVTTGQVVGLQSVAMNVGQSGLVGLDQTVDDLRGRHLTDAHQKELNQRDTYARNGCIDPQHERDIIEENNDHQAHQAYENQIKHFHSKTRVKKLIKRGNKKIAFFHNFLFFFCLGVYFLSFFLQSLDFLAGLSQRHFAIDFGVQRHLVDRTATPETVDSQ